MMKMLELTLPVESEAVPIARRSLEALHDHLTEAELEDARLMVSELVTNSLRHAGGTGAIGLRADIEGSRLTIQVRDDGEGFTPVPRRMAEAPADSGWGLYLVDQLADRWGATLDGTKCVWFELQLDG